MFLSQKFTNTRSMKGLLISVALPESQPTPARLILGKNTVSKPRSLATFSRPKIGSFHPI